MRNTPRISAGGWARKSRWRKCCRAAAAAFAALPPDKGEPVYLQALALHLAGKQDEATAATDMIPADSPWALKAKFLKATSLTASKKHQEAEAIYAAEAARAFSPARRDVVVKALLEVADEAVNPVAAGEVEGLAADTFY